MKNDPFINLRGLWSVAPLIALLTALRQPCAVGRAAERQVLTGHVPAAVAKLGLKPVGRLPATNQLRLAIGLPLRHTNELAQLLRAISDPASAQFRQYLTPEQFTERFGPTEEDYEAVMRFAVQHGLSVTATSSNRVVLDVAGPVSAIENALNLKLQVYQHPTEQRTFYAPEVEPSLEAGLAVADISGLANYARPQPKVHWAGGTALPGSSGGSGPGGNLLGKDMRNAYLPGVALTGSGQSVGLVEFASYSPADVAAYEDWAGLPHVPLQHILLDAYDGVPDGTLGQAEADLDIDMAVAMAPGLAQVVIFDAGPYGNMNDILSSMVRHPGVKQFSCSAGGEGPPYVTSDNLFQEMALQGQTFVTADGDADSWNSDPLEPGHPWPNDDPYVLSVGGTALTMTGQRAGYLSETVWNLGYGLAKWDAGAGVGSGGGVSPDYALPAWQMGLDMSANQGSTTKRNHPDVAMAADNFALVFDGAMTIGNWGSSFAAPLWAGVTALINEQAAAHGEPPAGLLNPAIYALGQSANYTNCFHDIMVGNNNSSPVPPLLFPAVPGYDLCSGWGTPRGSNLINALALPQRLTVAPDLVLAFTNLAGATANSNTLTCTLTNRLDSLVWTVGQNVPWLDLSPQEGTLQAGGPATVVAVTVNALAGNLAAGSYHAQLYFSNLSDHSILTRGVNLAVVAPPAILTAPASATAPEGASVSFTVTTATNAPLSFQWQCANGNTTNILVDGDSTSGSGTSTLTISDLSLADAGTYWVTVSNLAGTVTSTGAALVVQSNQPPVVVSQPSDQSVPLGATASFSVAAVGDQPLSYAWQFEGTNLTGGSNISGLGTANLRLGPVAASNSGSYAVVISNSAGTVTSVVAVLSVPVVTATGASLESLFSFATNAAGIASFGAYPLAGLLQARDGSFYGTAAGGGADGGGTVFRWAAGGGVSLVYSFTGGNDGAVPYSALAQASSGTLLYGTTAGVGDYAYGVANGTVFQLTTSGTITGYPLTFGSSGAAAFGALIQGRDGNFYGTTAYGGPYAYGLAWAGSAGYGTVFQFTRNGALVPLGSFNFDNGANPASTLVQAADGNFYGTTTSGGTNGGNGTIFRITPAGTITPLISFGKANGAEPIAGLTLDYDGSFYGTTYSGGTSNAGTVFKLASDGTFSVLYSFTGGNDGSNCFGGLLLASDGNLYGTTESGGEYGFGTVFRISRQGALNTVANFDGYQGATPDGTLIQGTDGKLYGTTQFGGAEDFGTIFRLSTEGPLQITEQPQSQVAFVGESVSFSVATCGNLPVAYQWLRDGTNLVAGGNIFGSRERILTLTNLSAADAATYSVVVSNSSGQVSSASATLQINGSAPELLNQPQSATVLAGATAAFSVQVNGTAPLGFQWQENGVNLTDGGNTSGSATPSLLLSSLALSNAGAYSVVVSNSAGSITSSVAVLTVIPVGAGDTSLNALPSSTGGSASINPYAGVIQGTDGNFYGTSLNGGWAGFGSVFELTPLGVSTVLYSFTNGADGASPSAGLVEASDGNFYGASSRGAGSPFGTLFRLTPAGVFSPLYLFAGGNDGGNPIGSLVQGRDGNLYGTASTGGTNGFGAVFRLSTNGVFTPLWSFQAFDGSYPTAPLVSDNQGNLYGTTAQGGAYNLGTAFQLGTNGVLTTLASFDYVNGAYPSNGLVLAADGSFYGAASAGGTNGGWGTIFRLTAGGSLAALHSFAYEDGAVPVGGLVQGWDGSWYGTTEQGGVGGQGTAFKVSTNGLLATLLWFNGPNGANPQATLIQASDGLFYGTAEFGGKQFDGANQTGDGLVFRLASDALVVTPSTLFSATGQPGGPFSPAAETLVLSNASASALTWSALTLPSSWVAAQPGNGTLAAQAVTNVVVQFSAAAAALGNGEFVTGIAISNWNTHVSQIETFALQIGQTILRNGGFETGNFTNWMLTGDTTIEGTIYDAVLSSASGYDVIHSGNYGAFLGDDRLATLSQTLPTVAGHSYLLSFWLDNTISGSGQEFLVRWNSTTLDNLQSPPAFAWTNLQFIATASGTNTLLSFEAENVPNCFGLDDVSVTPVPVVAFQSAVAEPNGASLAWLTASGLTYQVQYKTNLSQLFWQALGTPMIGTGFPLTLSDTNGSLASPQRFYRLVVSP